DLRKKYPQFDFIALAVGRLEPEKNSSLALEIWREVVKKNPLAGLVIIGSGSLEKSLKLKAKSLKLEDNVIFEQWKNDLVSYYKTADVFLNTSFYEGYGLAMAEARAASLPVISTDVGAVRELGCEIASFDGRDFAIKILAKIPKT
ncbi:MAG: glycosyltransferase, partial [Parcubacteria group bacterium Gr01-1014_73]